ncbi:hypothetical protein MTO96_015304 [Rhipicephalus appendiculatus]
MISNIPEFVALGDSDNDGLFECLTAKRTELNAEKNEATFVLKFKGQHGSKGKTVPFHLVAGSTPDTFIYTPADDPTYTDEVKILYSNFDNCAVAHGRYYEERCILYVSKNAVSKVPQECTKKFEEICGISPSSNWNDVCRGDE